MSHQRRDLIKATVLDSVARLLYYDRKEDEELPLGAIEAAYEADEVHPDEIVAWFFEELSRRLHDGRPT